MYAAVSPRTRRALWTSWTVGSRSWVTIRDRVSVEMLCVGCVLLERQDEVEVLKRYLLGEGAGGYAIFDPDGEDYCLSLIHS